MNGGLGLTHATPEARAIQSMSTLQTKVETTGLSVDSVGVVAQTDVIAKPAPVAVEADPRDVVLATQVSICVSCWTRRRGG